MTHRPIAPSLRRLEIEGCDRIATPKLDVHVQQLAELAACHVHIEVRLGVRKRDTEPIEMGI